MTGRLWPQNQPSLRSQSPQTPLPADDFRLHSDRNVFSLLVQREISPKSKYIHKRRWGEASQPDAASSSGTCSQPARDAKRCLISWVEAESLRHLSAKYCPLVPPPRSTIAAAFSSDGRILASTHGDHTVKMIDCETGNCLKVLSGHRRTPWVVRFHPLHSDILASGSLDHEVRLWNTKTSECIGSHDFYRPIASLAFHAEGELLAVASGHKLYIWHYNKRGIDSTPTIVLKTRRSLRAVHFHPHVAPFLLTAEVNDIDSSDSSMARATSPGYLRYPPPAIFVAHAQAIGRAGLATELPLAPLPYSYTPSFSLDDQRLPHQSTANSGSGSTQPRFQTDSNVTENHSRNVVSAMATSVPPGPHPDSENSVRNISAAETRARATNAAVDAMDVDESQSEGRNSGILTHAYRPSDFLEFGQLHQLLYSRDRASWELPFLQGWLMAQTHANSPSMASLSGGYLGNSVPYTSSSPAPYLAPVNLEAAVANLEIPGNINLFGVSGRGESRERSSQSHISAPGTGEASAFSNSTHDGNDNQPIINRIQSELATSLAAAAAAAELPCTVKLRVWSHNVKDPHALLKSDRCRLTIPHAVLCSEMGAHFSPCGRFLAACVACVLPHAEADPGLQTLIHQDTGLATSPTRHPVTAHQVMYELRVYSLEEATFGSVLVSRAIRAAHCLTSIQFSPTSEHILLAYGRRHGSLLKSIVIDGDTTSPIYTVLEVYRVSDMELVRVLPSAEDEVNVACFHPSPGGGLVYGTKEGKLRIFRYNSASSSDLMGPDYLPGENLAEVQTYALEC